MAVINYKNEYSQSEQLDRWSELIGFWRWYPDLFLDAITPTEIDEETGEVKRIGIELGADQRLLLRTMCRFPYNFEVLSRGYGKTTFEIAAIYIMATLYPDTTWSMSAQTLQTSAGFFSDKHADICRFYPILAQEIEKCRITDNLVEIIFKSGSVVSNVTNGSNAKGLRRNGITFEEAALMEFSKYRDNTEPLTSEEIKSPRYQSTYDPYCKNKQNFVTTAYFKNEAFDFCKQMVLDKANCRGAFVYGASYRLPAAFGRGRKASQVEALVDKVGVTDFNHNYGSRWSINNGSCIVSIDLLRECQTLMTPELKAQKNGEYYIAIDVARSAKEANNASAIAVLRVRRDARNKVREIQAVNLIKLRNGLNFKQQAVICKQICKAFNAQTVIVDINGLGKGLMDYLLDEQILDNGESMEPYDMINTDYRSEFRNAKRIVYGIEAQSNNTEMIIQFQNVVETKILRLLEKFDVNKALDIPDEDYMISDILPFLRTENFIGEVQNVTVEQIPGTSRLKTGMLVKADKDIFSAVEMGCYYIMRFCNTGLDEAEDIDLKQFFKKGFSKPNIRKR